MKVTKIPLSDGELCHFPKQFHEVTISEDRKNQMCLSVLASEDTDFKLRRIELEHVSNIAHVDADGAAYVGSYTQSNSGTFAVVIR